MSGFIEIRLDSAELENYLNQLADKTSDLRPLMKKLAGIMHDSAEQNFESEGRPKWPELKPSTIKQRSKRGYWPGRILQVRGELAASITSSYDNHSAFVGTNKVYAAIHHFGGNAGRNKNVDVPARPYLKVGESENKEILNEFKNYFQQ